jgi:hypothetical protein
MKEFMEEVSEKGTIEDLSAKALELSKCAAAFILCTSDVVHLHAAPCLPRLQAQTDVQRSSELRMNCFVCGCVCVHVGV